MKTVLRGNIVTPLRVINGGEVEFENGIITYAGSSRGKSGSEVIDCGENYISPGFIDLHVHGGGGGDFMDADIDMYSKIAKVHQEHGTSSACR